MAVYYLDCEPGLLVHGWIHPVDHALHGAVHWLRKSTVAGRSSGAITRIHAMEGVARKLRRVIGLDFSEVRFGIYAESRASTISALG
jgi:hypothetical protein